MVLSIPDTMLLEASPTNSDPLGKGSGPVTRTTTDPYGRSFCFLSFSTGLGVAVGSVLFLPFPAAVGTPSAFEV